MADQDEHQAPVGSVAEEAARLLDALGGWVSTSGYAAAPASGAAAADASDGAAAANASDDPEDDPEDDTEDDTVPPAGTPPRGGGHCEHCGAANGSGQALTCQWCPVCQGMSLLRSVRPETVDRLADLAAVLATALRDVATRSRGTTRTPEGSPAPGDAGTRGPRVQDITVDDEDQGSAPR